jgi:hypothetical protein
MAASALFIGPEPRLLTSIPASGIYKRVNKHWRLLNNQTKFGNVSE